MCSTILLTLLFLTSSTSAFHVLQYVGAQIDRTELVVQYHESKCNGSPTRRFAMPLQISDMIPILPALRSLDPAVEIRGDVTSALIAG